MIPPNRLMRIWALAAVAFVLPAAGFGPSSVSAQSGDGFLFQAPRLQVTVRGTYSALLGPRSSGGATDVFGFTQGLLTIADDAYDGAGFGVDLAYNLHPRWQVVGSLGVETSRVNSEYRDWVDQNDLPIEQQSRFWRRTFDLGARYFLTSPGRAVSRFAWVPAGLTPYIGASVGLTSYEYFQSGDFIDFSNFDVFRDALQTDDHALSLTALAGLQLSLSTRAVVNVDARYRYANGSVEGDFVGFQDLDLSGVQFSVGLGFRL